MMTTQRALGRALLQKATQVKPGLGERISGVVARVEDQIYVSRLYIGMPVPWDVIEEVAKSLHVTISEAVKANYESERT